MVAISVQLPISIVSYLVCLACWWRNFRLVVVTLHMTLIPNPERRFLRFSLRTFLLCVLVISVLFGWKVQRARKQREAVSWIQQSGGTVGYDYEIIRPLRTGPSYSKVARNPNASPPATKWLRELVGIDFVDDVVMVFLGHGSKVTDVTPLAGLKKLERLDLYQSPVSDLSPLAGLTNLIYLDLRGTQVSQEDYKMFHKIVIKGSPVVSSTNVNVPSSRRAP